MKAKVIETALFFWGSFFAYFKNYNTSTFLFLALVVLLTAHLIYKETTANKKGETRNEKYRQANNH